MFQKLACAFKMYKTGEDENSSYRLRMDENDLDVVQLYQARNEKKEHEEIFSCQKESSEDYYEYEIRRCPKVRAFQPNIADPRERHDNGLQNAEFDLPAYLTILGHLIKCDKTKFVAHNNSTVGITTASGDAVCVSADNFHGFLTSQGLLLCKVCRVVPEDRYTHTLSLTHMNKITVPIKDSNLIRQLDETWSHCILCNHIIENEEHHILTSLEHKTSAKAMTVDDATKNIQNQSVPPQNGGEDTLTPIHGNICQRNIPNDNNSEYNHLNGQKHEENENKLPSKIGTQQNPPTPNAQNDYSHYSLPSTPNDKKINTNPLTKDEALLFDNNCIKASFETMYDSNIIRCKVCQCIIPKNRRNIIKHILCALHRISWEQLLQENKLNSTTERINYCKICHVFLRKENVVPHIFYSSHPRGRRFTH